ncbi:MAG TPA: PIN domain-containing protein [Bryobacteraceae bacterium]|nr:PIN domain-containing protein [Bryobacteraceae bacterium]
MSAVERFFVDTNVLLYAADPADPSKRETATLWLTALWKHAAGRISWQVLHEFYVNAVRKMQVSVPKARATVETFAQWQPVDTGMPLVQRAWHWMDKAELSYWDSLIVAAAERISCAYLLSEDFQAGQQFDHVTVINPFHTLPREFAFFSR